MERLARFKSRQRNSSREELQRHAGVEVAAKVLRHSDSGVTQVHYMKESKQVTRAREAAKKLEAENLKQQAAGVLAQGLKTAERSERVS